MNKLFNIIFKTFASFKRAKILKVVIKCTLLTTVLIFGIIYLLSVITTSYLIFETEWLNQLFTYIVPVVFGIGGWFVLPAFMILASSLFQEEIINKVEKFQYKNEKLTNSSNFTSDLIHDFKFTLVAIGLNILILPFTFLGFGLVMHLLLNSYLLGREFFESVVGYYIGRDKSIKLSKQNKFIIYTGGLIITIISLIPVINVFVPIFATVLMIHTFHNINSIDNMFKKLK